MTRVVRGIAIAVACLTATSACNRERRDTVVMFRDERSEEYPRFSKRVIESYQQTAQ